jgi:hypothetical protein
VIDPGHGGREKIGGSSPNNAAGANGLLEKNLTLDIALRMASVLKDSARVLLTRNDDVNLSLTERANLARRNDAAIFLSLHFNGFKDRNVDGAEVFVASRAGAPSERLARLVLDHLVNVTRGANRGVKRADLGVLLPDRHLPQTAACLAEIAFLTNPAQAKNLEDAAYRQQIAAALGDAILKSLSSGSFSLQSLPFDYKNGHRLYQGGRQDDIDYQMRALDAKCDNSAGVKRDEKYLEFALMSRESDRPNKKENVFLRWCDIPKNRCEVDVVVHFHGWDIRSKKTAFFEFAVKNSGLDLLKPDGALTRQRPTLCILPFGKGEKMPEPDKRIKYTFPFFTSKNDGLQQLIDFSLKYLADRYKSAFTIGRLILTAHSGGGAALSSVLQKLAKGGLVLRKKDFDEIHLFDSTYGDQQSFIDWATNKINASETSAKSGALRVIYQPFNDECKKSGTTAGSQQIEKGISSKATKYPNLNLRYRVQPTRIEHLSIPKTFGFQLLANASADLDDSFVNKDSVHPCCQKSPAECSVKEPAKQQSLSFEGRGTSPGMRMTAGLDAGRGLGHARAMDGPKPGSAPTFIEENLLKDHPLSTGLIVVASKKGKKGSKAYVEIKESPSVFVPQILRLAAKIAGDEKRADLAAQLAPDQWFTRFTRSIALPGGKTADLTFLGRKLKQNQYIHVELAKTLQRIEDRFVQELKSTPEDAGDILLKKSDEGISGTRAKSSTAKYSYHMFGLAVDVNYLGNPFIQSGSVETVNNVLKNAASLMNTDAGAYAPNAKGKFNDRFDYIQAMDILLERYFGLLDDQTGLERYRSGSSAWRTLSIEAAKKKVQTDLDVLSGALERGDTKDYKRKDYFKKNAILNFDKRFVLGMERMGLYWGGHYGDMMHFDLRNAGAGDYVRRGISQYQKSVDSLAESLFSEGKSGAYRSDGQPA